MSNSHYGYLYKGLKVGLRPLSLDDLNGNYLCWFNDYEIMQYSSNGIFHNTLPKFQRYIESLCDDKTKLVWAIDDLQSKQHIGNLSLQSIDYINRSAELAIIIGEKSFWGKGCASEAANLALKHAFERLNMNRIHCGTALSNESMCHLAESLGMKQEGQKRHALFLNGIYVDAVLYAILQNEYREKALPDRIK